MGAASKTSGDGGLVSCRSTSPAESRNDLVFVWCLVYPYEPLAVLWRSVPVVLVIVIAAVMTLCVSPIMEASRKVRGYSMEASVPSTEASIICSDSVRYSSIVTASCWYNVWRLS